LDSSWNIVGIKFEVEGRPEEGEDLSGQDWWSGEEKDRTRGRCRQVLRVEPPKKSFFVVEEGEESLRRVKA